MYLPTPKAGLLSIRIGIGTADPLRGPLVAAVHLRVVQPERAHRLVHTRRAGARRAREPHLERVRGVVVGADEHRREERRDAGSGRRHPVMGAKHGNRDRQLERRGRREPSGRVPRGSLPRAEILDVDAARPREAARERDHAPRERAVEARCHDAGRGALRQAEHGPDEAGRAPVGRIDRRHAHPGDRRWELDPEREPRSAQRAVGEHALSDADDHPARAGRHRAGHEPERDLTRRRRDDHWRR